MILNILHHLRPSGTFPIENADCITKPLNNKSKERTKYFKRTITESNTFQFINKLYRIDERRRYKNIFEGLDNSHLMNFEELRLSTFRDIFSCRNKNAKCLKKPLNFLNYSNEPLDILTKKDRDPLYNDLYGKLLVEYEPIKPPPFDLQANMIMAKKRQKASLDK